ncbi:MAG TPA: type II toxin-antitoxin system YafQ family toxin [Desulfobacteraceae bacterium]|nr:type II toxin-antitoxin system YafQ family toxin [Desulfobacteraceae bacterium]HRW95218.1 type II toxin-antitoxin system YafQ family toxin [Bacteroidales bacterium]
MYIIEQGTKFRKDLKKYSGDKEKLIALRDVIRCLETTGTVPLEYKPHPLKGEYSGTIECHIKNDFLLIWMDKETNTIKLVRLGSHSELFR